jgi:hypothetical protein
MAPAHAGVATFDWDGVFTMLDGAGAALANTSIPAKGNNQFQTPVTGTMAFDTVTGAGTATLVPFDFFSGTLPAEAVGINMQAIGDGMGGAGTLVMGNMLFNWNGNTGIPVSLVLDAEGFFTNGASAATPASDGTYVGATVPGTVTGPGGYAGYLGLGPVPIATTAWNTSFATGCAEGACDGVSPSGVLPMVFDSAANPNDFTPNTGGNIGGNPMADGSFQGSNANFDVTVLTPTGFDEGATIAPFCDFDPSGNLCAPPPPVPVPAAVWLFGSGLLGLVGVARRRKVIS